MRTQTISLEPLECMQVPCPHGVGVYVVAREADTHAAVVCCCVGISRATVEHANAPSGVVVNIALCNNAKPACKAQDTMQVGNIISFVPTGTGKITVDDAQSTRRRVTHPSKMEMPQFRLENTRVPLISNCPSHTHTPDKHDCGVHIFGS